MSKEPHLRNSVHCKIRKWLPREHFLRASGLMGLSHEPFVLLTCGVDLGSKHTYIFYTKCYLYLKNYNMATVRMFGVTSDLL